jgi:hypothetical protein
MKNAKGKPVSEKQIEAALRKWERRLEPLRKVIARSEHITADDLKIMVY